MNATKTSLSAFIVSAILGANAASVQAETLSEYIEKQQELEELDYEIEKYDRMIQIKEAKVDYENVGQDPKNRGKSQNVNGARIQGSQMFRPSFTSGDNAAIDSQMQAREQVMKKIEEQQKNEQARLAELAIMQEASIIEVYRSNDRVSTYAAVLDVDGKKREVYPGDKISHWTISHIGLNEVTARNEKYDGITRTIKQIR